LGGRRKRLLAVDANREKRGKKEKAHSSTIGDRKDGLAATRKKKGKRKEVFHARLRLHVRRIQGEKRKSHSAGVAEEKKEVCLQREKKRERKKETFIRIFDLANPTCFKYKRGGGGRGGGKGRGRGGRLGFKKKKKKKNYKAKKKEESQNKTTTEGLLTEIDIQGKEKKRGGSNRNCKARMRELREEERGGKKNSTSASPDLKCE